MAHRLLIHLPHSHARLPLISSSFFSTRCLRPSASFPPQPPPSPKKIPFTVSVDGRTWQDPYQWMSNTDDPHLLEHLNRENSYTNAFMADTLKL
ncbi:protease 2-like, partial [Trifolium medium]|nr:protease 2-like [Trifolium medium]